MVEEFDIQETLKNFPQSLAASHKPETIYPTVRPLLAHYTSLQNIENILEGYLWLSNPLLMNDHEEVRFGIHNGINQAATNEKLRVAIGNDERQKLFSEALQRAFDQYGTSKILNLYVMCFSEHSPANSDGVLSMWRGYGNHGKGAALVFNTEKLNPQEASPFIISHVDYDTQEGRRRKLNDFVDKVAEFFTSNHIPDKHVSDVAERMFLQLCLNAVFSKHCGFDEEKEWRLVYFQELDQPDHESGDPKFSKYYSYFNAPTGIQPKMKLPIREAVNSDSTTTTLENLVHSIIIGPTASSPIAVMTIKRMLKDIGLQGLVNKVQASTIPFRG